MGYPAKKGSGASGSKTGAKAPVFGKMPAKADPKKDAKKDEKKADAFKNDAAETELSPEQLKAEAEAALADDKKMDATRAKLLETNLALATPRPALGGKRDKSIIALTKIISKFKKLTDKDCTDLQKQLDKHDCGRFLSEICDSMCEATATMKLKEVPSIVDLCCKLHNDYAEFSATIFLALTKTFQQFTEMTRRRVEEKFGEQNFRV